MGRLKDPAAAVLRLPGGFLLREKKKKKEKESCDLVTFVIRDRPMKRASKNDGRRTNNLQDCLTRRKKYVTRAGHLPRR